MDSCLPSFNQCFNEAAAVKLRKVRPWRIHRHRMSPCFNEAAAVKLRKVQHRPHGPHDPTGFNEAAAVKLRKGPGG